MNKSQGSVLLVSLVMLLIMTVAGLTAIKMSSLEEKVSGNYLNQQIAFQAAEIALLEAENQISNTLLNLNDFDANCSAGFCFHGNDVTDIGSCSPGSFTPWSEGAVWTTSSRHNTTTLVVDGVSAKARYIIEFRCYIAREADGPLPDLKNPEDWAQYFRITALATGGTSDARVMLQTTYKKNS
ncbi:hypothetical protein ACH42_16015 [Endozoicomonas sp. (ex Bugula neritina AB1)]|nr:hypothetical protein ACH42_16015 [Endozoicomonas sp. (ex Bugula neritina AB1)]